MAAQLSSETVAETALLVPHPQTQAATTLVDHDHIDLTDQQLAEDEVPLPAYGNVYGEIRDEKNGTDTSACVSDDGRVNIRIGHLNRHLSQIFTPALSQQIHDQDVQSSLPRALSSLEVEREEEEKKGVPPPPPPRLNVVIQVVGSRGDVQPFVALGKVLKESYGHRVRLATHPVFKDFVEIHGLEFFSIGGDPTRLMAYMVKNPGLRPGFRSVLSGDVGERRKDVAEYIQGCWRSCYKADDGTDNGADDESSSESRGNSNSNSSSNSSSSLKSSPKKSHFVADYIIANPPSFAHIHCAEKLGIPLHIMFTMPYSPTQAFPHPLVNIQSSNVDPQLTNYISYAMLELLSWQVLGDIINRFRSKCLGLDPISTIWAPGILQRLKIPHTYCWSPALIPKPKDWGSHISISGFNFLDLATDYTPAADLQAFLDDGPPPVYIGFGSIVLEDPDAMMGLIFEATRKTGQRVLLSKGWGGIGADELLHIPDGVFMLGNVPHDWLFKHVSCVVHHGGAGTTAAGISAGRPTVVVPFFGDQPFWGAMIARAGAGPDPIPHKKLTADKLADAIKFCLKPESLERAKELATKIAAERSGGSDMGAQSIHRFLDPDSLRCTLAPSRCAVWCVRRSNVRLSPFAACTLANAKLLDLHDLKLFRPQEHYIDEGPWDPISGGFTAFVRAVGGMMGGLADVPLETWRALQIPAAERSRQQQQQQQPQTPSPVSEPTIMNNSEASQSFIGERLSLSIPPSRGQRGTNLGVEDSLTHAHAHVQARSPSNLYDRLIPTSDVRVRPRSMMSRSLSQGQLNPKQDDAGGSRLLGRNNESSSGKDADMLRPTGVHMSKGAGRFVKALVQAPVDLSVNFTRGFHNIPKLWGDDTVRPQERVTDFKSGVRAMGREFGLGWYDGITGVITQPWKGAQNEGASGFVKGVGKGIGGFLAKPSAALFGILGHTMQGISKEVQKLFGRNVQNYIVASRVVQGYEEWLQSSDAEKQDVIARWKLVQQTLEKMDNPDEMVREALRAQQQMNLEANENRQNEDTRRAARTDQFDYLESTPSLIMSSSSQFPLGAANTGPLESFPTIPITPHRDEEEISAEQAAPEENSSLQHHQQHRQAGQADLRQARTTHKAEAEAQRHASDSEGDSSENELKSNLSLDDSDDANDDDGEVFEKERAVAEADGPLSRRPPSYDLGHLAGTTRDEFEAQQSGQQREKTAQEKAEEETVMEYIKKQSLLELQHQQKAKGRATAISDLDDENLQKALRMSMQESGGRHEDEESSGL